MKTKPPRKFNEAKLTVAPAPDVDTGITLRGLAKEMSGAVNDLAEALRRLYRMESASDQISELASALHNLANATAMSVVAQNGTNEDRAVALEYLKGWFEEFRSNRGAA